MDKKAQGLSINVIIIVAISLIVLVVLIAVFTGRMGSFTRGVTETATCKSNCISLGMEFEDTTAAACVSDANYNYRIVSGDYPDVDPGDVCCCKKTR